MSKIPPRFEWAKKSLPISEDSNILEIGCGTGILASLLCEELISGHYTGIDKSTSMIEKARKKNTGCIQKGKADFILGDLKKIALPPRQFDIVLAFNVNIFLKNSPLEFGKIKEAIKNNGQLHIFYQAPYELHLQHAEPVIKILKLHSFKIIATKLQKIIPTSALSIAAHLE